MFLAQSALFAPIAFAAASVGGEGFVTMSLEVPVSCQGGLIPDVRFSTDSEINLGEVVQSCNVPSQSLLFYTAGADIESITFLIDGKPIESRGGMLFLGTSPAFSRSSLDISIKRDGLTDEQIIAVVQSISVNVASA